MQKLLNGPVSRLHPIEGGELSKVFSYSHQDKEFVIHFNGSGEGFEKERYIHETFSSQGIPVPKVLEVGRAGELYFSIAEKAPGRSIVSCPQNEVKEILPTW